MLKIAFYIVVFMGSLHAKEFYINPYYLDKLQKDSRSYNIINHYVAFLNRIQDDNNMDKIEKVNIYINRILPRYDSYTYKKEDYWATPFEFFSNAGGDCEDYVIAKQYSLGLLGFSQKDMYLSVVKEKFQGGDHMVLSLHVDKNSSPIVLDNLSTKILPVEKRVDLEFVFMFNEYGFYKLESKKIFVNIEKINLSSYRKLNIRNRKNLILVR